MLLIHQLCMHDRREHEICYTKSIENLQSPFMKMVAEVHNPLHGAGYCLDPEFHSDYHSVCPEALKDLFCMCELDKVHGAGS